MLVFKLVDHRPSVSAAAVKAAACVMQHAHTANPAVLANKLLQQHQQQQADTGSAAGQQDTSGLLEVLILVGHCHYTPLTQLLCSIRNKQPCTIDQATDSKQHHARR